MQLGNTLENPIGIFSFFAGAGFLDLGFEKTGRFETLFVNEIRKPFLEAYRYAREKMQIPAARFGYHQVDISEFLTSLHGNWLNGYLKDARQTHSFVGFIGGPPCPDFSVAGKNKGQEGENGRLSKTYVDLVCTQKPDFFLFENVKGLYRTAKHRAFFNDLKIQLQAAGFCLAERLVNAIEYGAPQDRERIILIGFLNSTLEQLNRKGNDGRLQGFEWEKRLKFSFSEISQWPWPEIDPFELEGTTREAPSGIDISLTVEHWFRKNKVADHPNASHYFQPRAGLSKFCIIGEGDDLKKSYKRLHRWRYSPTAAYGNNEVHLHPYLPRRISASEALAIQSLPREFELPPHATLSDMFKMIGNGVPFLAANGIAQTIYDYIIGDQIIAGEASNDTKAYRKQFSPIHQSA